MTKIRTQYICQQCGRHFAQSFGRCPNCQAWNSIVEEIIAPPPSTAGGRVRAASGSSVPDGWPDIDYNEEDRVPVAMGEFTRVLGGGIVPGSIVLIGGDPGIGKSTLMLQMAMDMADKMRVLYISGEESEKQIKMRAVRLLRNLDGGMGGEMPAELYLVTETNLEVMLDHVQTIKPALLVVNSVQTTYRPSWNLGGLGQLRCVRAPRLRELAKGSGISIFLIGHVTKEGAIAGPRGAGTYRRYRSVPGRRPLPILPTAPLGKESFGATSEVGVFEMHERGMIEVTNPSEAFLAERMVNAPGFSHRGHHGGHAPAAGRDPGADQPTRFGNPRRTPNGVDFNRLLLTEAVLTRRLGVHLGEQDVFVNVVGGIRIRRARRRPGGRCCDCILAAQDFRSS